MIRTIAIASYISVQGFLEGPVRNGIATVRVGNKTFTGRVIGA